MGFLVIGRRKHERIECSISPENLARLALLNVPLKFSIKVGGLGSGRVRLLLDMPQQVEVRRGELAAKSPADEPQDPEDKEAEHYEPNAA